MSDSKQPNQGQSGVPGVPASDDRWNSQEFFNLATKSRLATYVGVTLPFKK